ncbi:O-antigen ligase family protein [Chloroflexota bacterium]
MTTKSPPVKNQHNIRLPFAGIMLAILVVSTALVINSNALSSIISSLSPKLIGIILFALAGSIVIIAWMTQKLSRIPIALALVIPFEKVSFGQSIGYEDLDLITPVLLLALAAILLYIFRTGKLQLLRTGLEIPILLFLFSGCLAAILSFRPVFSLFRYIQYAKVFVLFFVLFYLLRYSKYHTIKFTLYGYLGSTTVMVVYSIIMYGAFYVFGLESMTVHIHLNSFLRLFGTLRDPNIAAAYLVTPLFLALYWSFLKRNKIFWLSLAGIFAIAIMLTFSRSGFLALFVGGLVWIWFNRRFLLHRHNRVILWIIIISLIIFLIFVFEAPRSYISSNLVLFFNRLISSSHEAKASNDMHEKMVIWAFESFLEKPWGTGRWNLAYYIGIENLRIWGYQTINDLITSGPPVHNSWLEILASEGIGGFIAFSAIIFITLRRGFSSINIHRDFPGKGELKSLTAGFVGLLVSMIFYTYDWMYFVWFIIAMISVLSLRARDNLNTQNA